MMSCRQEQGPQVVPPTQVRACVRVYGRIRRAPAELAVGPRRVVGTVVTPILSCEPKVDEKAFVSIGTAVARAEVAGLDVSVNISLLMHFLQGVAEHQPNPPYGIGTEALRRPILANLAYGTAQ
eukprot:scaffold1017_cov374-Prasinococcus_capsulatus_cf.AAC.12